MGMNDPFEKERSSLVVDISGSAQVESLATHVDDIGDLTSKEDIYFDDMIKTSNDGGPKAKVMGFEGEQTPTLVNHSNVGSEVKVSSHVKRFVNDRFLESFKVMRV